MSSIKWPSRLFIVRHGESAGNVAFAAALAANQPRIGIEVRDADVPLSENGLQQAHALGRWFQKLADDEKPQVLLMSPFLRAQQTGEALQQSGHFPLACPPITDERYREKEFGHFDGLTSSGIKALFPEQAALRARVGKFYYRPPGGESWCDVIFRLRSALDSLCLHHAGRSVLIVGHEVIVFCLRYLLEQLNEQQVLDIDKQGDIANCSITEYVLNNEALVLKRYNDVTALNISDAPITVEPRKNKAGA